MNLIKNLNGGVVDTKFPNRLATLQKLYFTDSTWGVKAS